MIKNILVAAAFGAVAFGAQAAPVNLVQNGTFEGTVGDYVYNGVAPSIEAVYPGFGFTAGTVADWSGSFVSITTGPTGWGTPRDIANADGALGGYIAGIQSDGTLTQGLTLAAGQYTLTWMTANRGGAEQNYSVMFGGKTVDTVTTLNANGWATESATFYTAGGTGLTFQGGTSFVNVDATSFIDNVAVTAVPEPTSLMLMALGTLGLLAWRRRSQV